MNNNSEVEIVIVIIVILLLVFLFLVRKYIPYPFCPLENYGFGSVGGMEREGKIFMLAHLFPSTFLSVLAFISISRIPIIDMAFESISLIRIASFIVIFLVLFFINGIVIEKYFEHTDKEYYEWKKARKNKGN
jgi:hypothetical protein